MEVRKDQVTSTTGTSIDSYLDWVKREVAKKDFGEVSIKLVVRDRRVVDVRKESVDTEHFCAKKEGGQ